MLKKGMALTLLLLFKSILASTLSIEPNPFTYSAEYVDQESRLQYLKARYYNPQTHSFIQQDRYSEEQKNNWLDQRYNYGAGDPVGNNDPSGHQATISHLLGNLAFGFSPSTTVNSASALITTGAMAALNLGALYWHSVNGFNEFNSEVTAFKEMRELTSASLKAIERALPEQVASFRAQLLPGMRGYNEALRLVNNEDMALPPISLSKYRQFNTEFDNLLNPLVENNQAMDHRNALDQYIAILRRVHTQMNRDYLRLQFYRYSAYSAIAAGSTGATLSISSFFVPSLATPALINTSLTSAAVLTNCLASLDD